MSAPGGGLVLPTPARIVPLETTCPGILEHWSGSLRAQVIVRLLARWCFTKPQQTATHINAVLVDALVDARGYVTAAALTKHLTLLHPGQIVDALRNGPCSQFVSILLPAADENDFVKQLAGPGDQNNNNNNNNNNNTTADPAEQLFAIDYRRALPFAHSAMSNYFVLLCSESVPTHGLPERHRGRITSASARVASCMQCASVVAWEEMDSPPTVCDQCQTNLCVATLESLLKTEDALQKISSGGNVSTRISSFAAASDLQNCGRLRARLARQNSLGALLEQGRLFLTLFRSKLVLVSRPGAPVVHPDRVFAAEEFSQLMASGTDGNSNNNNNNNRKPQLRRVGVRGTRRPLYVEPAGVTDERLPGLRIVESSTSAARTSARRAANTTTTTMTNSSGHHHHHHSAAFPPWLRDETPASIPAPAEEGFPVHNASYRDLSQSSDTSSSSSSCSSSRVNAADQKRAAKKNVVVTLSTDKLLFLRRSADDDGNSGQSSSINNNSSDGKIASASGSSRNVAAKWQAVHVADRQLQIARLKRMVLLKKRRQQQAKALRRQRDEHNPQLVPDDSDEWEQLF